MAENELPAVGSKWTRTWSEDGTVVPVVVKERVTTSNEQKWVVLEYTVFGIVGLSTEKLEMFLSTHEGPFK